MPELQRGWLPEKPVLIAILVLVFGGLIVYANSFAGQFQFDDIKQITANDRVKSVFPLSEHLKARRPLVNLSLAINYELATKTQQVVESGVQETVDPWGYHLVNVAIHILAALVLFGVLRRTLLLPKFRDKWQRHATGFAGACALLWLVHPLQTQSVTYIIQRAEALMGLFYLTTLYCVIRGATATSRSWIPYALAIGACLLGMASKGVMITAPFLVVLYDRLFLSSSWRELLQKRGWVYLGLGATLAVLFTSGVVRGVLYPPKLPPRAAQTPTVGFGVESVSPVQYAMTQPSVILHYLRLSVIPLGQCIDWNWPVARIGVASILTGLGLLTILGAFAWFGRRHSWVLFLGAWLFVILAPTSSFIPIRDLAFEHRMYLSLAAVIVLGLVLAHRFLGQGKNNLAPAWWGVVAVLAVTFGGLSVARNSLYSDEQALWADVVAKAPHNGRGWEHYARTLHSRGEIHLAAKAYRDGIQQHPDNATLHSNFGVYHEDLAKMYQQAGNREQYMSALRSAEESYRQALLHDPNHHAAHANLGNSLAKQGRYDESIEVFQTALRQRRRAHPWTMYAKVLIKAKRYDDAERELSVLLSRRPDYTVARVEYARVLRILNRPEEARDQYRIAVEQQPENPWANYGLANCERILKNYEEAIRWYQAAIKARPSYLSAYCDMGLCHLLLNQVQPAERALRHVLSVQPKHRNANFHMARIADLQGQRDQAIQHLRNCLEVDPSFGAAQQMLQALQQQQ